MFEQVKTLVTVVGKIAEVFCRMVGGLTGGEQIGYPAELPVNFFGIIYPVRTQGKGIRYKSGEHHGSGMFFHEEYLLEFFAPLGHRPVLPDV
jgi:hypothetical protein